MKPSTLNPRLVSPPFRYLGFVGQLPTRRMDPSKLANKGFGVYMDPKYVDKWPCWLFLLYKWSVYEVPETAAQKAQTSVTLHSAILSTPLDIGFHILSYLDIRNSQVIAFDLEIKDT